MKNCSSIPHCCCSRNVVPAGFPIVSESQCNGWHKLALSSSWFLCVFVWWVWIGGGRRVPRQPDPWIVWRRPCRRKQEAEACNEFITEPAWGMFHNQSHRQLILQHTWTRSGGKNRPWSNNNSNNTTIKYSHIFVLYKQSSCQWRDKLNTTYQLSNLTFKIWTF